MQNVPHEHAPTGKLEDYVAQAVAASLAQTN